MPELILQVVSMDAMPPSQPLMRAFSDAGGTIGRDESNVFALPDKHRRVSRLHATISFPGGMATITNSSTSLPISVGEHQVESGESMPLANGALVEIGPYVLRAVVPDLRAHESIVQSPTPQTTPIPPTVAAGRGEAVASDTFVSSPKAVPAFDSLKAPQAPPDQPPYSGSALDADQLHRVSLAVEPTAKPMSTLRPVEPNQVLAARDGSLVDTDPFANLLSGIGGAPSASSPLIDRSVHSPGSVSADPLAAFEAAPGLGGARTLIPEHGSHETGYPLSRAGSGGALIPDDFNPFELPSSTDRNAADPLANLLGTPPRVNEGAVAGAVQPVPSIDSLFQSDATAASAVSSVGSGSLTTSSDGSLGSLLQPETASDPFALFGSNYELPSPANRPMRDDALEVGSAFLPPAPIGEDRAEALYDSAPRTALPNNPLQHKPPVTSAAAPVVQQADGASPDALTEAFLRGAGLARGALPHGLTPEIMTIVGSLLRSATAGAVDMLAARAATKREVQASVTIISVQANNPLKFLPNADAALLQLLGKKMPGFMRADVAMRDAFEDLRAHEVGVIAGTRAALTEVLGKFDPAVLGDKLARGSVLESLVPSARKAKLWDMYLERYLQIRREAEDDFQSIFGRAFVQAYERETARIKGDSTDSGEGRA